MIKSIHFLFLFFALLVLSTSSCNNGCRNVTCNNKGICYEGECLCEKWYSGIDCSLKFNRNYAGIYYGEFLYENGQRYRSKDSLELIASEIHPNRLMLLNGMYMEFDSDSTLVIPMQRIVEETDTFYAAGAGKHISGSIYFSYNHYAEFEPTSAANYFSLTTFSGELVQRGGE